jgi:flagellar secretion chaperone FliS
MILGAARHYKQYQQDDIFTSSQGQLILMMYEGAIKNISMAIDCIDQKDIPGKGVHIRKAHDIINELSLALDMEKGGDVSSRLERLYQYILSQLTLANIKSETKILKSVLEILNTLLGAWTEVINKQKVEEPTPPEQALKRIASKC